MWAGSLNFNAIYSKHQLISWFSSIIHCPSQLQPSWFLILGYHYFRDIVYPTSCILFGQFCNMKSALCWKEKKAYSMSHFSLKSTSKSYSFLWAPWSNMAPERLLGYNYINPGCLLTQEHFGLLLWRDSWPPLNGLNLFHLCHCLLFCSPL